MAIMLDVVGVESVIAKLRTVSQTLRAKLRIGLIKAGRHLQRESQKVVPVDTSNLKNSAFTRDQSRPNLLFVEVGYTAHYGIYVHEDLTMHHKPGKIAKFLEEPLKNNIQQIKAIIVQEARMS